MQEGLGLDATCVAVFHIRDTLVRIRIPDPVLFVSGLKELTKIIFFLNFFAYFLQVHTSFFKIKRYKEVTKQDK